MLRNRVEPALESSPRAAPTTPASPTDRSHRRAALPSIHAAAPITRAGCLASPPRCDRGRGRRAETGRPNAKARARLRCGARGPPARGAPEGPARRRARRARARQAPREAASQQTRASLPTPRPAIARRRRHRAMDAPAPPRRARSGAPARRGTDPAPVRGSSRTRSRGPDAVAEGVRARIRAAVRTAGARTRTQAPSRIRRPQREGAAFRLPIPWRSSGAPSSRPQVRREGPGCDSRRPGWPRSCRPTGRTPFRARASPAREPGGDWPLCLDPNPTREPTTAPAVSRRLSSSAPSRRSC